MSVASGYAPRRPPRARSVPDHGSAILAAGPATFGPSTVLGFFAVVLASVNIFGGFIVTQRMLQMFKKKPTK